MNIAFLLGAIFFVVLVAWLITWVIPNMPQMMYRVIWAVAIVIVVLLVLSAFGLLGFSTVRIGR